MKTDNYFVVNLRDLETYTIVALLDYERRKTSPKNNYNREYRQRSGRISRARKGKYATNR